MPKNIDVTTDRNQLQTIPGPNNSGILEHKVIADLVINILSNKGIAVIKEEYRTNINNDIIQGVLHLSHTPDDPTYGLMITWINSYEKTTGFRCEMGSFNKNDGTNLFIARDSKAFRRNSTDLVVHTTEYLEERISEGLNNFGDFLIIRDKLKDTTITKDTYEKLIGSLYFKDAITSSQLIALKSNHKIEQAHNVLGAWLMIAKTFKSCHPKAWFKQQSILSENLIESYIDSPVVVDPAQTDLITMIDEVSTGSDFDFEMTTYIESVKDEVIEEVIEETEPTVLSLDDYDLAVKVNIVEAEPEVEAVVEEEVTEVEENPVFSLDSYDPSGFPLPPEDLPMAIVESDIEYTERVASIEGEPEKTDNDLSIDKAKEVEFPQQIDSSESEETPPTMEETYDLVKEQQADEEADMIENEEIIQEREEESADLNSSEPVPLEEQVAMSEIQPISEAEAEVSEEPVIDEPIEEYSNNDSSSNEATMESPNFEF